MKKLLFATCCIAFLSGSLGAAAQKKICSQECSDTDFEREILVGR
ncbi:MAG: hypothetical protein ACLR8W_01380 [Segatella copri]